MTDFAALHVHSQHSLMDGVASAQEYFERAESIGMKSLALTDHGTLAGHREWVRKGTEFGIKPILGIEAYFTEDRHDRRDRKERGPLEPIYNHLVILAQDAQGLINLNKINKIAWEDFFHKPRIDWELLDKYGDGLIISSACMSGVLNKAIEEDNFAVAKQWIDRLASRFGDDFYVEVMPHNVKALSHGEMSMNDHLLALADEMGVQSIVTPDCHHADPSQREIQEFMLLTQTHAKLERDVTFEKSREYADMMDRLNYLYGEDRMMSFQNFKIHLMSGDETREAMAEEGITREDILNNTGEIADSIESYDLKENLNLLPKQYRDPNKQLRKLVNTGLNNRGLHSQEYLDRIEEELEVIFDKDLSPYFLLVSNMTNWAHKENILLGPGRGSSAGSLVCYALKITGVDPIKHGLLFSRFLDPGRDDAADIDIDSEDIRRDEMKAYLTRQYRHVSNISTFSTFKDKVIVRDVSRVLNIPLSEVNKVLKTLDTWEEFEFGKSARNFREEYPEVVRYGRQMRGRIRGVGVHPAGVVVSKTTIANVVPTETRSVRGGKERVSVIAADMAEIDRIGLIKIDNLGLKTLTVIKKTLDSIEANTGEKIILDDISLDDKGVYSMLSRGETAGVFQCESPASTKLIMRMGVDGFSDLVLSNALVRPGAMNTIGEELIARKHGKVPTTFIPGMKDFTANTYGEIVFQEDVMQACITLGDMTTGESNKVRRIIGKKKDASEFDFFKSKFIGAATPKIGAELATKLWHDFEAHAGYSFSKNHAVPYSMVSYWTAWLKLHYAQDYMTALLNYGSSNDTITGYLIEVKRLKIPLYLPHINKSGIKFQPEGRGIRMGLSAIKWISDKIASRYIAQAPYDSYEAVRKFTATKGSGVNTRALGAMKAVGALSFEDNPVDNELVRENLYEYLSLPEFGSSLPSSFYPYVTECIDFADDETMIMFGMIRSVKRGTGWSRPELLDRTGSIGVFDKEESQVEPGKMYLLLVSDNRIVKADSLSSIKDGSSSLAAFLGMDLSDMMNKDSFVVAFSGRTTKAGKKMATLILSDNEKELSSAIVWPTQFGDAFIKVKPGKAHNLILTQSRKGDTVYRGVQQ